MKNDVLENPENPYKSNMVGYPDTSEQINGVDVVEKSKWCKRELNEKFPEVTFHKSSKRYAGGSSFTIKWVNGPSGSEVRKITSKYSHKGKHHDPQYDMYQVDNYVHVDRKVTNEVKSKIGRQVARVGPKMQGNELWRLINVISFDQDGNPVEIHDRNGEFDLYEIEDGRVVVTSPKTASMGA